MRKVALTLYWLALAVALLAGCYAVILGALDLLEWWGTL